MALTAKKKAFAQAKHDGANNKEAAIFAGCSPETASQAGSRMAKDPDVIAHLERLASVKDVNIPEIINNSTDPLELLSQLMNDELVDMHTRLEVAIFLLPYFHSKHA